MRRGQRLHFDFETQHSFFGSLATLLLPMATRVPDHRLALPNRSAPRDVVHPAPYDPAVGVAVELDDVAVRQRPTHRVPAVEVVGEIRNRRTDGATMADDEHGLTA